MPKKKPLKFVAIFRRSQSGEIGVDFPNLTGCVSFGADLSDARKNAIEALSLHLAGLREDGDEIPAFRDIQEILDDEETDLEGKVLVTLVEENLAIDTQKIRV